MICELKEVLKAPSLGTEPYDQLYLLELSQRRDEKEILGLLIRRILPATQTRGERERKMQRKKKIKYCPTSLSYSNLELLYWVQNAETCYFQVVCVLSK